jgi:hypothetical protein
MGSKAGALPWGEPPKFCCWNWGRQQSQCLSQRERAGAFVVNDTQIPARARSSDDGAWRWKSQLVALGKFVMPVIH